jgi:hypothetical protein
LEGIGGHRGVEEMDNLKTQPLQHGQDVVMARGTPHGVIPSVLTLATCRFHNGVIIPFLNDVRAMKEE